MCQQIIGSAVYIFSSNNVIPCSGNVFNCIGNRCCTGSDCKCCNPAFQRCNPFLKHILCRIRQPSIDIAGILKCKSGFCMI